jgi:sigma-B regulation protein RsbU (phosphoserine phosphatase)
MLPMDANIPVGVMNNWKFTAQGTQIEPGTTIFLYTDGLTEAENINHEQFGEERIREVANTANLPTPLIKAMSSAVSDFVGEAEQSDDLTMLAIQYTKQQLAVRYSNELSIVNDLNEVERLATFVEQTCEAVGFDMATTMQLNLALEEAVVNVINYGYPNGTKGDILIEAQANDQRLKFIITDSGVPFDPTAKEEVDTTLSAEERPIGGLGIHLVRKIMDSINYERHNGHNVLTLRKKINNKQ